MNDADDRDKKKRIAITILTVALGIIAPAWIQAVPHGITVFSIITCCIIIFVVVIVYVEPLSPPLDRNVSSVEGRYLSGQINNEQEIVYTKFEKFLAEFIPDVLTAIRPALGISCATCIMSNLLFHAFLIYSIGLVSDILDGMFARALKGSTSWGKMFDAYADSFFNLSAGFGIVVYAAFIAKDVTSALAMLLLFALFIIRKIYIREHTLAAKYFSGAIRVVLFVYLLGQIPSSVYLYGVTFGIVLLVVGGAYEFVVSRDELRKEVRSLR
jgi:phosphatidylglycerophosphate synthase